MTSFKHAEVENLPPIPQAPRTRSSFIPRTPARIHPAPPSLQSVPPVSRSRTVSSPAALQQLVRQNYLCLKAVCQLQEIALASGHLSSSSVYTMAHNGLVHELQLYCCVATTIIFHTTPFTFSGILTTYTQ